MKIMEKLLDNLGVLWNRLPKEAKLLNVSQGSGKHTRITIDEGVLYLHSLPYHRDIPERQAVVLDNLTADELVTTLAAMGYVAEFTSEAVNMGLNARSAVILLEKPDLELPTTLTAFTSNLWRVMYPIYRIMREAEFNTTVALQQMYRPLASGEWLDFWADFFSIKREPGEDDQAFNRRFTMWLFNPKTNNVALEELLAYRLQDNNIKISDRGPLEFELLVGTKYIEDAAALHKILQETKAAGVEYFLNYQADLMEENYPISWADRNGRSFRDMDGTPSMSMIQTLIEAFRSPSEAAFTQLVKAHAEIFPAPSEAVSIAYQIVFAEAVAKGSEAAAFSLTKIMSEAYPSVTESVLLSLNIPASEVYELPPESNMITAFRTNRSKLNASRLIMPTTNPQDYATITLTRGGEVVAVYNV